MIPSWFFIAIVSFVIAFGLNRLSAEDRRWFNRLRRPEWLTFEWAIPFIWMVIFICGAWSAYTVWEVNPGTQKSWFLMAFYVLVEIVIMAYTPLMCKLRSLQIGTIIGGVGFCLGLILAMFIFPVSQVAVFLLLPYLLWSPIGTYVTWKMIPLNLY